MLTAGETTKELDSINQAIISFFKAYEGYTAKSQKEDFTFKYIYQYQRSLTNLLRIIPETTFYNGNNPSLTISLSSLSSLIRNLWDILIAFIFHIRSSITEEDFRYKNLLQHYLAESKRLQLLLKINPKSPSIDEISQIAMEAKNKLVTFNRFKNLEKKVQQDILKADRFSPPSVILMESIGVPADFYNVIHIYLSNHTHYYAYGFSQDIRFKLNDEGSRITYCRILEYAEIASLFFLFEFQSEIAGTELFWDRHKERILHWKDFLRRKLYQ